MKTITRPELLALLASINTPTAVEILAVTSPKVRVNTLGNITKETRVVGKIGVDYGASVRGKQLASGIRPTFKAGSRKWGHATDGAVVEQSGRPYLAMHVEKALSPAYFVDGKEVPKATVNPYLPNAAPNRLTPVYGSTRYDDSRPTADALIYRNYKLDSVREITIGAERYRVTA